MAAGPRAARISAAAAATAPLLCKDANTCDNTCIARAAAVVAAAANPKP